jgi:rhamnosyltransferase
MTSGSLLAVDTFQRLGPFEESLFIDSVDHAFSLRIREAGLVIRTCGQAVLLHAPGHPKPHTRLGIEFHSTNYPPIRRYYQERNKIWIYRRYGWKFPGFCWAMLLRSFVDLAKIWLAESDRPRKSCFFLRGIYDGLRGRMGKYNPEEFVHKH